MRSFILTRHEPSFSNPACRKDPPAPCVTFVFCSVIASWFLFGANRRAHDASKQFHQHQAETNNEQCTRRDPVNDKRASENSHLPDAVQAMDSLRTLHCDYLRMQGLHAVHTLRSLLSQRDQLDKVCAHHG